MSVLSASIEEESRRATDGRMERVPTQASGGFVNDERFAKDHQKPAVACLTDRARIIYSTYIAFFSHLSSNDISKACRVRRCGNFYSCLVFGTFHVT